VFRLLKLLTSLALLGGFIWFGMRVPLGSKTLFDHLRAIGGSRETKDLVEGTKEAARPVLDRVERTLSRDGGMGDGGARGAADERHDDRDRRALRHEVGKHAKSRP
jgi:hypothetical protein